MIKTMTANQKMAELFQRNKSTISRHIFYVSESGESEAESVVAFFATTAANGKTIMLHTTTPIIISAGFMVNSLRGIPFHIWATQVLREYLVSRNRPHREF